MFLLASVGAGQILGDAGMTVLIGFAVVFMMLLLLTGVFKLFGLIMAAGRRKKKEEPIAAAPVAIPAVAPAATPIVGNTETVASKPDVDGGIPEETVAVVSAAVAAVAPAGTQYAVRGIRKL